jgi:hypothetical protein
MSRFFFHVMDGYALLDAEGTELANLAEARSQAIQAAGAILADKGQETWDHGREWVMSVTDETGRVVFTLRFSADHHGLPGNEA